MTHLSKNILDIQDQGSIEEEQIEEFLVKNFEIMKVGQDQKKINGAFKIQQPTTVQKNRKNNFVTNDQRSTSLPGNQDNNHAIEQNVNKEIRYNDANNLISDDNIVISPEEEDERKFDKDSDPPKFIESIIKDKIQESDREGKNQSMLNESNDDNTIEENTSDLTMIKNPDVGNNKKNHLSSAKESKMNNFVTNDQSNTSIPWNQTNNHATEQDGNKEKRFNYSNTLTGDNNSVISPEVEDENKYDKDSDHPEVIESIIKDDLQKADREGKKQ